MQSLLAHPIIGWLALAGLCAAYIQGGLTKLLDLPGAVAEARHFGLPLPPLAVALTIMLELGASALILTGYWRWAAALALAAFTLAGALIANRFWERPPGQERAMTTNAFFEHLGLIGAFVYVARADILGEAR
jgi:uncharacterized membrane protein YphA (DoxX/SURF4 family)